MADPRWEEMTTTVGKNRKNMTGPLLMVANPHAFFQLADSLSPARRYYLTIKDLDHNDFISQGSMTGELRHRLRFPTAAGAGGGPPTPRKPRSGRASTAVKSAYESLCVYVLRFLDAELKGDAAGKEFLATQYRDTPLAGAAPHVEYVPPGVTGAEPYAENSSQPPTPRQLRDFLRKHGSAKTVALFRRFRKDSPTQPIYHQVFGWALVGDLLDQGKTQDAIAFRDYYREFGVDFGEMFLEWGQIFTAHGAERVGDGLLQEGAPAGPLEPRSRGQTEGSSTTRKNDVKSSRVQPSCRTIG